MNAGGAHWVVLPFVLALSASAGSAPGGIPSTGAVYWLRRADGPFPCCSHFVMVARSSCGSIATGPGTRRLPRS